MLAKIKGILDYRINLSAYALIIVAVLFMGLIVVVPSIQNNFACRKVAGLYDDSLSKLIDLDSRARSEWKTFPRYSATDEWSQWQEAEGWKDPSPPGGPIYRNFRHYWKEKYEFAFDREYRIKSRLVVNHPECFDPRTVTEEQEVLAN